MESTFFVDFKQKFNYNIHHKKSFTIIIDNIIAATERNKEMKKRNFVAFLFVVGFCILSLAGCTKDLTESVTQKQTRIEVGTDINLIDLFECEEGIKLGFKNSDSFNSKKIGSYSIDATISDEKNQSDKSYLIEVYDDVAPEISAKDIVFYENQEYNLLKDVSVVDNSGEEIEATISEQNVDNTKAGKYSVKYQAIDSSGNLGEHQITVTVKPKHTFSELKNTAKKIVKEKSLNKLEVKTNSDKDVVWVQAKDSFEFAEKKSCTYNIQLGWALIIEDYEISYSILVAAFIVDKNDYLRPENVYIKSDNVKIESDSNNYYYDLKYGYAYSHLSYLQFLFTDKKKIDKSIDIFDSNNVQFNIYTDKYTLGYKTTNKDKKVLDQLVEFYQELSSI